MSARRVNHRAPDGDRLSGRGFAGSWRNVRYRSLVARFATYNGAIQMSADGDTLLARAAAAIENARSVRTQTQVVVDEARLQRLNRELITKMQQIERLIGYGRNRRTRGRLH
jgi:hypothetical protein